uniref:Nonstructural protein P9-2 n=1 Tax=Maize rough dwarf virus TaxID=10989 RepID=A0A650AB25_MRDV|nr:nonstructural protein P9-2 [Maize rough dwarf virus]QGN19703.1 nonstructural protein P9-2 [Maize rough dwarf virus]
MNPQSSVNIDTYTFNCPFELAKIQIESMKPIMQDFSNFDDIFDHALSDSEIDDRVEQLEIDVESKVDPIVRRRYGKIGHIIVMIISFVFFGIFKLTLKMFYHLFRCVCCNPLIRGIFSIIFTILFYFLLCVCIYLIYYFFGDQILSAYDTLNQIDGSTFINSTQVEEKVKNIIHDGSLFFGTRDQATGQINEIETQVVNGGTVNYTLFN